MLVRYKGPEDFLTDTAKFRANELVRTNLISSIATSVINGTRKYESYFWWSLKKDDEVLGVAIRTAPYGYVLSPMPNSLIPELIAGLAINDPKAREFAGPKKVIDEIAKTSEVLESEGELIYHLKSLKPSDLNYGVRIANAKDYELVLGWMRAFILETQINSFNLEGVVKNNLQNGNYYLLIADSIPVSLGGISGIVELEDHLIGRVGPVYTPMEFRKRGYASAITSYVTQALLDRGAIATLYTQATNPTSNKIYQELGYELVDENRKIKLK
jgi:predicted GNAT family acetyltransferase